MSELTVTHRSTVTEDQIDHLGHMNVRFYGVNARAGSDAVVDGLGGGDGLEIEPVDLYTRHHREQLLGAPLEVRTGVLGIHGGVLRLYHELVNSDTGALAATFVHCLEGRAPDGPSRNWPPAGAASGANLPSIELPEHGRPRSISLDTDHVGSSPDLATVRQRKLAMRHPRTVDDDETGPGGRVLATDAPGLLWAGEPLDGATGPSLHDGPGGQLIGWASMETRMVLRRLPRAGDRIQSFGATVEIGDKVTQQMMWAFDLDREDLLCTFEVVNLAFDTVSRRAVSIPDELREHSRRRFHPDLRPTP